MIKGKTKSGFKFEVRERLLDDWRFLNATQAMLKKDEQKQVDGLLKTVELVLDEKATERLMEHLADEEGIVPIEKVIEEFGEILEAMQKDKNVKKS